MAITYRQYAEMLAKQAEINEANAEAAEKADEAFFAFCDGRQWTEQDRDSFFTGQKIGSTLRIRLPSDFVSTAGPALEPLSTEDADWDDSNVIFDHGALTRLDISTGKRVEVTQEWIDEAVAEIVRLNVELGGKAPEAIASVDRIWEAVRAAAVV